MNTQNLYQNEDPRKGGCMKSQLELKGGVLVRGNRIDALSRTMERLPRDGDEMRKMRALIGCKEMEIRCENSAANMTHSDDADYRSGSKAIC